MIFCSQHFKLFVPSGYASGALKISGKSGVMPDVRLMNMGGEFYRSKFPNLKDMTFTFGMSAAAESVLNFYHLGEFFIISGKVFDLFSHHLGDNLETVKVTVRHQDGSPSVSPYFAARVNQTIDCIDSEQSKWRRHWPSEPSYSFGEGMARYELDERCWDEFSNDGNGNYVSYPSRYLAENVRLIDNKIPVNTVLFQPTFWPGQWLIEESFAQALEKACLGGYASYYFWTLDIDDLKKSNAKLMQALR